MDLLIRATNLLFEEGFPIHLHIVGVKGNNNKQLSYYGNVDPSDIPEVSNNCHIGVYPGDAGLSVLHYMCLGLCPVTHSSLRVHSGPEPAYVHIISTVVFSNDLVLSPSQTLFII